MKKLMIAAALAAAFVGTASAAENEKDCAKCVWGYKVMLVAKTTIPASVSNVYARACGCYRKPTMGKLVGYLFGQTGKNEGTGYCGDNGGCACNAFGLESSDGVAPLNPPTLLLWKAWNGAFYPIAGEPGAMVTFQQLDRIGYKDRSTAEILWGFQPADPTQEHAAGSAYAAGKATFALAGFGKCAHRADGTVAIKNANGFFVAQMYSYCQSSIEQVCGDPIPGEAVPSHCWAFCQVNGADVLMGGDSDDGAATEDPNQGLTVAYGKWQMVWDSQLVARFHKSGVNALTARPSIKYQTPDFIWAADAAE